MKKIDIPVLIDIPWATDAAGAYVRVIPDTTADPVAASWALGFPPAVATPVGAGGTPPDVRDFNGGLNQISAWSRWLSSGAAVYYNSAFSASIGGYPQGTILSNATTLGSFWLSTVDDNTSDPDTGGANWLGYSVNLAAPTGSMIMWPVSSPPTGWLERNGASLSTGTYGTLFSILGYTFGGSGGAFNLPDDRGLFERGWDDGAGVDPGRGFGTFQGFGVQAHTHPVPFYDNNSPNIGPGHGGNNVNFISSGSFGISETRPSNRAYLPIIKF